MTRCGVLGLIRYIENGSVKQHPATYLLMKWMSDCCENLFGAHFDVHSKAVGHWSHVAIADVLQYMATLSSDWIPPIDRRFGLLDLSMWKDFVHDSEAAVQRLGELFGIDVNHMIDKDRAAIGASVMMNKFVSSQPLLKTRLTLKCHLAWALPRCGSQQCITNSGRERPRFDQISCILSRLL